MKITTLAAIIGVGLSHSVWATTGEQDYFRQTYQTHYQKMTERLSALYDEAESGSNVSIKDGQRYLTVNGTEYRLTADNQIIFDLPKPTFLDETAIRNVFDFFNDDWELSWYDGGVVAVNKLFGNYNYGNGCLMEYYPRGTIQQGERTHVVLDNTSCQVNSFDTKMKNLDIGEQLLAEQLGLDANLVTAVERYKNSLYVTQNSNPGKVIIIDIPSKQVIGDISGINTATGFAGYNYLSELYIRNNLLYVVSRFSHRIDIFDLDNNHQHVTTLGTGKGGAGSNRLDRAQAVVANDHYVMVADSLNLIKVYRQEDVTPENNLKIPAIGHLQFEGKYSNRFVQMHLLKDYLIVHTAGKNYYIYDLRKLDQSINDGVALAPEQIITDSALQKMDTDGDQLVVNFKDHIAWYQIDDFISNGFRFTNETFSVNRINQQPISALKDVHLAGDTLVTANNNGLGINKLLTKEITFVSGDSLSVPQFNFDQLLPSSVSYIFDKDEPYDVLINRDLRSVNINSLVKTELIDNEWVRITNYAAKELHDINIESKLSGINKWFVLGQFDRLPAYAQIILPLSAFGDNGRFNSANRDGIFDLNALLDNSVALSEQLTHRFSSNSDPFAQKLSRLKPSWNVRFATKNPNDNKWRAMNALYAKEWLIIATNLAYIVSAEEFKHVWFNFKDVLGYDMFGNGGNNYVANGIFKAEDYEHYYQSLMKRPTLNVGITSMGGGLGSAGITGIDTFNFVSHYYGSWGIIAHEFGYGFDGRNYSHNSAFARGSHGWHPLITVMANYHIRKGDLPYMDDNLNGFYKPENAIYRYAQPGNGGRKYRSDSHMYPTDHYFMQFSNMPMGWLVNEKDFSVEQLAGLNNQEQLLMGTLLKDTEKRNLCRFTFTDNEQYYGYVEPVDGGGYRCEAGEFMRYRQPDGQFVTIESAPNQFDWLSLHMKGQLNKPVLHQNGQPLCYQSNANYYGIGFVNGNNQCVQLPNIYHTNGNKWVFSKGWAPINYISGDFIVPTAGANSDFTLYNFNSQYPLVNGKISIPLVLSTANPVNITATLEQSGNVQGSASARIDGDGTLLLELSQLTVGDYDLLLEGMAEGGKQGSQQRFSVTLIQE
ncbi:MAG: hypothetical protein ACRC53_10240 [Plesiomonas sp.]|uniref:YncE family protein n=1 Tax=Plesiomonas sp. TaxID=2486279 RepID=UPI003F32C315